MHSEKRLRREVKMRFSCKLYKTKIKTSASLLLMTKRKYIKKKIYIYFKLQNQEGAADTSCSMKSPLPHILYYSPATVTVSAVKE